jgi:hypothetical protein
MKQFHQKNVPFQRQLNAKSVPTQRHFNANTTPNLRQYYTIKYIMYIFNLSIKRLIDKIMVKKCQSNANRTPIQRQLNAKSTPLKLLIRAVKKNVWRIASYVAIYISQLRRYHPKQQKIPAF